MGRNLRRSASVLLAAVAVVVTAAAVWHDHRPTPPKPSTWEDVLAEARAGGYRIISTKELADRHRGGAPDLLVVDTRQGWEYRAGLIEGARHFPMEPTRWTRAGALEAFLGPDRERTVVFY
jgi:hypothetical protein